MAVSEYVLKTANLTKTYQGKNVLNQVNIAVKKGSIYGFIGLNGAGKSTLIKIVSGLAYSTSGKIELFGQHLEADLNKGRKRLGTLIENPGLYPSMTANENLEVVRIQRGIPGKGCIEETLKKVGLQGTGKKKVKKFSLGMKQRLGIAIALLNDPELLILDEPINGLDPMGVIEIRELLKRINQEYGVTIIISSHILSEVHQLATNYGIIHKGELIEQITAKQLDEKCRAHLFIQVNDPNKAVTIIENTLQTSAYEVMPDGSIKLYSHLNESQIVTEALINGGLKIEQFTPQRDTLESYFTSVIQKGDSL
jgi:ABC-2 type transport system ATP-binding protein